MSIQKDVKNNINEDFSKKVEKAFESILNNDYNIPGWPIWVLEKELPDGGDDCENKRFVLKILCKIKYLFRRNARLGCRCHRH